METDTGQGGAKNQTGGQSESKSLTSGQAKSLTSGQTKSQNSLDKSPMNGRGQAEELILRYTREYLEKMFYFCLKKTGSAGEAEELCADISLQVTEAFHRGAIPENFPAYVFQIAKNRYRLWAIAQKKLRTCIDVTDTGSVSGEDAGVLESMIKHEDLKLLRRELALISEEYRGVVVAYYIDDRSIKDISISLGLPEGTVKAKLFRARKILKEGMHMAREFGPKSYNPEKIDFVASGEQPSGLPWSAVKTMFSKNVLLEASENPSTVEELSVALGIAAPYMKEEVDALVRATLLKKTGSRYVTNFPIVSRETREKIYALKQQMAPDYAELVDRIAADCVPKIREAGYVKSEKISDMDIRWWAVCICLRMAEKEREEVFSPEAPIVRENGESWEFYGLEGAEFEEPFVSYNGYGRYLYAYIPHQYGLGVHLKRPNEQAEELVVKAVMENRKFNSFSDLEKAVFQKADRIAHAGPKGEIVPDILFIPDEKQITGKSGIVRSHPLFAELNACDGALFQKILNLLRMERNAYIKKQFYGVAHTLCHMRGLAIQEEVSAGRLILPENPKDAVCTAAIMMSGK